MMPPDASLSLPPFSPGIAEPEREPIEPAAPTAAPQLRWLPVAVVAVFAGLLASFPARNSDLWMHLAGGKRLLQSPHSFAAAVHYPGDPRLNPSWLYDLVCYALYSVVGGSGLVFFKALLVVGLALILLNLSRIGKSWWIPVVCTSLAILAMSVRLLVHPATVSYFFLALCLWFLFRRQGDKEIRGVAGFADVPRVWVPPWQLLVLFLVWANVDSGFVIGLGVVALVWLGRLLDSVGRAHQNASSLLVSLSPCLLVSFALLAAVCLLNPSHIHALTAAPEWGWIYRSADSASASIQRGISPFQQAYFANLGVTPVGMAYFPLLGLGLVSFLLDVPGWRWQRVLPWFGLAVLSSLQVNAIPFFAVLAGPVLAWNLQEFFAQHSEAERAEGRLWGRAQWTLRTVTVLLGFVFIAAAWPGWLQEPPYEPRHWAVEPLPALERGAAAFQQWHEQGKLAPEARGLHLSPMTASAFAWFCPEEKGVLDERLAAGIRGDEAAPDDWQDQLRAAGVNHIIVYDPRRGRLLAALNQLLADPAQWPLLYLGGDLAVFGWRDPLKKQLNQEDEFRSWALDLEYLAFHPEKEKRAPASGPYLTHEQRQWWEAFWKPAPPRAIDRDEATLCLLLSESLRQPSAYRHVAVWETLQAAGLIAAAGGWMAPDGLTNAHIRLMLLRSPPEKAPGIGNVESGDKEDALALGALPLPLASGPSPLAQLSQAFLVGFSRLRDDTPPGLLYLTVRAARRALAVNPEDPQAYLVLGQAYMRMLQFTRERDWGVRLERLGQLRRVQASAALNQAIALKPDLAQAHFHLGALYREMGYLDLALTHLRTHLQLSREAGAPTEASAELFRKQQSQYENEVQRLADLVEDREKEYEAEVGRLRLLDRAVVALNKGLVGRALDMLLETDLSLFGPAGRSLELELLLRTGRSKDVLDWTDPQQGNEPGASTNSYWQRIMALMAAGEYERAQEEYKRAVGDPGPEPRIRQEIAKLIGQAVIVESPATGSFSSLIWKRFSQMAQFRAGVAALADNLREAANTHVLRGLIALEQGDVDEAQTLFRLALDVWKDEETAASGGSVDFSGRVVAQTCLAWLK